MMKSVWTRMLGPFAKVQCHDYSPPPYFIPFQNIYQQCKEVQRDWAHHLWPLEVLQVITINNSLLEYDTLHFGKYVPSNLSTIHTGPGAHPASYTMGTGSFLGVKQAGRGTDHPHPSSAEVKERVELYLYSPSGPSWPVLG
jgi:hypothetical protein